MRDKLNHLPTCFLCDDFELIMLENRGLRIYFNLKFVSSFLEFLVNYERSYVKTVIFGLKSKVNNLGNNGKILNHTR